MSLESLFDSPDELHTALQQYPLEYDFSGDLQVLLDAICSSARTENLVRSLRALMDHGAAWSIYSEAELLQLIHRAIAAGPDVEQAVVQPLANTCTEFRRRRLGRRTLLTIALERDDREALRMLLKHGVRVKFPLLVPKNEAERATLKWLLSQVADGYTRFSSGALEAAIALRAIDLIPRLATSERYNGNLSCYELLGPLRSGDVETLRAIREHTRVSATSQLRAHLKRVPNPEAVAFVVDWLCDLDTPPDPVSVTEACISSKSTSELFLSLLHRASPPISEALSSTPSTPCMNVFGAMLARLFRTGEAEKLHCLASYGVDITQFIAQRLGHVFHKKLRVDKALLAFEMIPPTLQDRRGHSAWFRLLCSASLELVLAALERGWHLPQHTHPGGVVNNRGPVYVRNVAFCCRYFRFQMLRLVLLLPYRLNQDVDLRARSTLWLQVGRLPRTLQKLVFAFVV